MARSQEAKLLRDKVYKNYLKKLTRFTRNSLRLTYSQHLLKICDVSKLFQKLLFSNCLFPQIDGASKLLKLDRFSIECFINQVKIYQKKFLFRKFNIIVFN